MAQTDRQLALLCRKLQGALRTRLSPCVRACGSLCVCGSLCECACVRACSRRPQTEVAGCTVPSEVRTTSTARIVRRLASLRRRPPQTPPECSAPGHQRQVYKVKEGYEHLPCLVRLSPHLSHCCLPPREPQRRHLVRRSCSRQLHGEQCAAVAAACNRSVQCTIGTMLWPSLQHAVATGGAAQSYGSAYVRSEFSATLLR